MLPSQSISVCARPVRSIGSYLPFLSAIVDEFFKNQYSTDQHYTMLNALALGANKLLIMSDTVILIVQMDVFP